MTTITAKTILRSRNTSRPEKVLSTLLLRYPRCIHSELMTHRVLSRNSASSRAIPVAKMIADIKADPYVPIHWGKNQKGMQAFEECNEQVIVDNEYQQGSVWDVQNVYQREEAWLYAMNNAIRVAEGFNAAGYHKQIVNRLLEPFMHITVLVSSTEWSNFIALRDHPDAEPHIQILAREIKKCLDNDPIQDLKPGEWHLPFVSEQDQTLAQEWVNQKFDDGEETRRTTSSFDLYGGTGALIKLSVARCASTSYKTVEGFDMSIEKAKEIYDKLAAGSPKHMSPFEHVAEADQWINEGVGPYGEWDVAHFANPWANGNFIGFNQLRKMIPGECL